MITHDFMDYIGSQFHPSHSVFILVLSIFLVLSCDINLMCWEAIDDHLLWAYYRTFSFFVCLLFLLIWPCFVLDVCWFFSCHPFCWLLMLLFLSHVFSLLVAMVEMVWRVMHCIYWLQTNAQICTDNFIL